VRSAPAVFAWVFVSIDEIIIDGRVTSFAFVSRGAPRGFHRELELEALLA